MAKFITLVNRNMIDGKETLRCINISIIKELASFSDTITMVKIDNETLFVPGKLNEIQLLIENRDK